jgi:hypothetical protein
MSGVQYEASGVFFHKATQSRCHRDSVGKATESSKFVQSICVIRQDIEGWGIHQEATSGYYQHGDGQDAGIW